MENKNIFKYRLNSVEDVTNQTFYRKFLEKERRKNRCGRTIYLVLSSISFNFISEISWDISKLNNDLKVVVIINSPKSEEELVKDFMNNIYEGNLSISGTYQRSANTLMGMIKKGVLEIRTANETFHLNVIAGYTTLMGIERMSIEPHFNNGYVFWEDYEEYAAEVRREVDKIYRKSNEASSIIELTDYIRKDYSVEEMYYLMLMNIFQVEEYRAEKRQIENLKMYEAGLWKQLYDFQKDGVYGLIHRLNNYGYAILADSVGLGKTYQALAVIQYYQEKRSMKTLVLTPVKLFENWDNEKADSQVRSFKDVNLTFDVHKHTTVTSQKTPQNRSVENFNYNQYGLLVIDEAHAFRNDKSSRYQETIRRILSVNPQIKVLLLSATPVNNSLKDLSNLINLMSKGATQVTGKDNRKFNYNEIIRRNQMFIEQKIETDDEFKDLLESILVSRDKSYVKEIYKGSELQFPEKNKAISMITKLSDTENNHIEEFYKKISNLNYASYNYYEYLRDERKSYFKKKLGKNISERSMGMKYLMRLLLLKRFESTYKSLTNTIEKMISQMERWLYIADENQQQFQINTILNKSKEILGENTEDIEAIDIFDLPVEKEDFKPEFFEAIREDIHTLKAISNDTIYDDVSDKKVAEMVHVIKEIVENEEKVIVFTSYSDTAEELETKLRRENLNFGLVTGTRYIIVIDGVTKALKHYEEVLKDFSPISKKNEKVTQEIDILIATDVVSEGQNLQDCSNIINFDVHWNPVRIIQRLGRIDRLGSSHSSINNYIFWPFDSVEKYLDMRGRIDLKNEYIEAVGSESYEKDSTFNTTKEQLEQVVKGIDIEEKNMSYVRQAKKLKKYEIDYKRIKKNINEDSIFFDIVDYLHELRGVATYVYSNEITNSCYLLYRVNSRKKFNSDLFPFILVELDEQLNIKTEQIASLDKVEELHIHSQLMTFRTVSNDQKRDFFREELKDKLKDIAFILSKKFNDIKQEELSLICSIYILPTSDTPYRQTRPNDDEPFYNVDELEEYISNIDSKGDREVSSQDDWIKKEKANNIFD